MQTTLQVSMPLITALFAGINGLFALFLSIRVVAARVKKEIDFGDGGDDAMLQTIRVQGNNAEYVALTLVILALVEMLGAPVWAIYTLGGGLTVGRLLHAQGLSRTTGPSFGRVAGQVLTFLALGLSSLYALYLFAIDGGV